MFNGFQSHMMDGGFYPLSIMHTVSGFVVD